MSSILKRVIPIAVLGVLVALAAANPSAQTVPSVSAQALAGFWVQVAAVGGKPVDGTAHRLRGFTDHEWYYVQSSPAKNTVDFLFGGTNAMSATGYAETVTYASPNAASMVPRVTTFQLKIDGDTLSITGRHAFTGSADTDSTEVWRRIPLAAARAADDGKFMPSEAELAEIQLAQQVYSAPPQNLAGAYLNNHDRLAMLAEYAKGALGGNVNVFLGGEKVTKENIDKSRTEFQHREDLYSAELKRRGTPQVGGPYRLTSGPPCDATAMDVVIKQEGFAVELKKAGEAGDHLLSGAVVAGVLTVGDGDFSADTYGFGKIGDDGRIEIMAFSGRGCASILTRVR